MQVVAELLLHSVAVLLEVAAQLVPLHLRVVSVFSIAHLSSVAEAAGSQLVETVFDHRVLSAAAAFVTVAP